MIILDYDKPKAKEFTDADRRYIAACESGNVRFKVVVLKLDGNIYRKAQTVYIVPSKSERRAWGYLKRALVRGYRAGEIDSYTLTMGGRLSVKWFTPKQSKQRVAQQIPKPFAEPEPRPTILRQGAPKRFAHLAEPKQPRDILQSREEVEARQQFEHRYVFSAEAEAERRRMFGCDNSCFYSWPIKFNKRYATYTDEVVARDSEAVLSENRRRRGVAE